MDCREIRKRKEELGRLAPDRLPDPVRHHLAGCPDCARALQVERGVARLLQAQLDAAPAPPEDFAARVLARLPARRPAPAIAWTPAWGLLPAFTAAAVVLLVLYQAGGTPLTGLYPLDDLSAGERLVLQEPASNSDLVLSAILEGSR